MPPTRLTKPSDSYRFHTPQDAFNRWVAPFATAAFDPTDIDVVLLQVLDAHPAPHRGDGLPAARGPLSQYARPHGGLLRKCGNRCCGNRCHPSNQKTTLIAIGSTLHKWLLIGGWHLSPFIGGWHLSKFVSKKNSQTP